MRSLHCARDACGGLLRCTRNDRSIQTGYILLPVVLLVTLVAVIAFMLNHESALDGGITQSVAESAEADYVARAGLAHAVRVVQNSGCSGDMAMTSEPFGQAGTDSYTATVTTPGGTTTAYDDLAADQDAWFRSDNITTNNGTGITHHLRKESGNLEYAVVRFDLSSLPAGAQINSAMVSFYVKVDKGHPEGQVNVHRVTADWTETGATWETLGDKYDSVVLATIPAQPDAGDVRVAVNLTTQVQAWVNGGEPNYGVMLIPTGEGTHAEYISREGAAAEQPRLDVVVGTGAASPMSITATGTLAGNPSPAQDITRTLTRPAVPAYQPPGTVTLQLGTDPGEDTLLDSFYDLRNYGGANYLQVHDNGSDWQQYPLIRFDLGRLPWRASVVSAQLELSLLNLNAPGTAAIHQVTRNWVEGTKSGGGKADGATWFTYDGTNPWTSAGGDINVPVVAETAINGGETWISWEIAPLVERWFAGDPNYGLLIKPDGALKEARFASKENSNVGVQPKLTITYACECGIACVAPQGSGKVVMIGDYTGFSPDPRDREKESIIESWGYDVDIWDDSLIFLIDFSNYDVVYVSETAGEAAVTTQLTSLSIGVVNEQGNLNDELELTGGSATGVGSGIDVTDNSHYITAPFAQDLLPIYSADMEMQMVSGTTAPGLQTLSEFSSVGSLVVLDTGMPDTGGGTAAGRRVILPLGRTVNSNFNWDYLNNNGRLIVQRAIEWGAGAGSVPAPAYKILLIVGNLTLSSKDVGYKALMESWGHTVALIDDGDSQANYDTAMAAADVVYASGSALGANIQNKATDTTKGLVNEVSGKLDNFGFSSSTSSTVNTNALSATDAAHYITESFSGNPVTVFTSSLSNPVPGGTLAPDLQNVGEVTGTLALGTLDTGATRFDGNPSPGRRAHLPFASAETTDLTADGQTILQRTLEWAAGAGVVTATAPIAHWMLDDGTGTTALDSVGGHHGTLTNGPSWVTGTIDGGLSLDGSNDYIDVPHDTNLTFTAGMTFAAWGNTRDTSSGYQAILAKDTPGNGASNYWFGIRDDELVFGFWAAGSFRTVTTSGSNLQQDTWYHLAASFDNATDEVRLYVDGTEVHVGSIAFEPTVETADLWIGTSIDNENWDGKLDDVRIYNTVLGGSEISDLAVAGGGGGGGGGPTIVEVRVATGNDDAEERLSTGSVNLTSSDLELISDGSNAQLVGMRFTGVAVANGATISNAWIQFQVDETNTGATNVNIQGETSDNALQFTTANANITSRNKTTASISWAPVSWTTVGEAGPDQRTPDISAVIQEIVSRPGWASGNDMVLLISGSGERTAESYNGDASGAALLHIEY